MIVLRAVPGLVLFLIAAGLAQAAPLVSPFADVNQPAALAIAPGNDWIKPSAYRALTIDDTLLRAALAATDRVIELPMPDGSWQRFTLHDARVMAPELQAKFPEIQAYAGQGIDDPSATLRLEYSPQGFHAQILSPNGSAYIDPRTRDRSLYAAYYRVDYDRPVKDFVCGVGGASDVRNNTSAANKSTPAPSPAPSSLSIGPELRTYRIAVAATGEYTDYHSNPSAPNVAAGLAAVVTAVNRVTGVYQRELGIRLELVGNNNLIIYTNAATDPYTNDNSDKLLNENQTTLDSLIGSGNYDIGHVFNTGGGGLASLGAVCDSSFKAQGQTGSEAPINDPFYIDYVAHEIGHQFDANHTFNGVTGSCAGGNRNAATAYEPGSGSTILAYAGICGVDDLQNNSDAYFHSASFEEIVSFITSGSGASCAVVSSTTNQVPVVDAGPAYVIPQGTPFMLTATGSDPDGDPLSYCWEERDLGPAALLGTPDNGSSPLFRSFSPTNVPWRSFPAMSRILSNTTTSSELLPVTARTMRFRVTARDNRALGGGVSYDETTVTVVTNAGPFAVTSFNTSITTSGLATVTWNVAGTTNAPVNASHVAISLSTNGGLDFPVLLNPAAPNTGSAVVALPAINTSQARIKVQGTGNIFYDVNKANFSITPGAIAPVVSIDSALLISEDCQPANGAVDPGETVTMQFNLGNYGTAAASNLNARLFITNGVFLPSSPLTVGTLAAGAQSSIQFTFTAGGTCGGLITPTLEFRSGTNFLGTAKTSVQLGSLAAQSYDVTNAASISIPSFGTASPYPSIINISNVPGTIKRATVTLRGVNHSYAADIDALLVGPGGEKVILMAYCGESNIVNAIITFDDNAPQSLPFSGLVTSGTYKPTYYYEDSLPSPAPSVPYGSALSVFDGKSPNGVWSLYVNDTVDGDSGSIAGWSINLEVESIVCCDAGPPPSVISTASFDAGQNALTLSGAGGAGAVPYYLHASTNMLLPTNLWIRIATNIADNQGFFSFTNLLNASDPQHFYMITAP